MQRPRRGRCAPELEINVAPCIAGGREFFYLFAIFILHLRESELYRYILDVRSALAWELPFRCLGHLSST